MRIKCAAILHDDIIYEGLSHAEIGCHMIKNGHCKRPFPSGYYQGFITEGGNYVDRRLAMIIAIKAKQVEEGKTCRLKELFSEDLNSVI